MLTILESEILKALYFKVISEFYDGKFKLSEKKCNTF